MTSSSPLSVRDTGLQKSSVFVLGSKSIGYTYIKRIVPSLDSQVRLLQQFGMQLSLVKRAGPAIELIKVLPNSDEQTVRPNIFQDRKRNPPKVNLENAHAWTDIEDLSDISCQTAILVRGKDNDMEIKKDDLIKYFQDPNNSGGPIRMMTLMHDGILIVFYDDKVAQTLAKKLMHTIGGKVMRVYSKEIPDVHRDKLVIGTKNEELGEDDLKSALTNASPTSISPHEITKCSNSEYYIASYLEPLDDHDMKKILQNAEALEFDEGIKVATLPKTDCIQIKGLPRNAKSFGLRIHLESTNFCSDKATITALDVLDDGLTFAYFSSYRQAEKVFERHKDGFDYKEERLSPNLYYHWLSDEHKQQRDKNWTGKYLRAKKEQEQAALSFQYDDQEEDILQFVINRQRHWEELQSKFENVARLEQIQRSDKIVMKVTPITNCDNPESAQNGCKKILEDFFSNYTIRSCSTFNLEDLEMVRNAKLQEELNPGGLDLQENDYVIKWTGNMNQILTIYGTASATEMQMNNITERINISSGTLVLSEGKYQWLFDSKEFSELNRRLPCTMAHDKQNCTLKFTGSKKLISEAKLEIYQAVEQVRDYRVDEMDENMYELLTQQKLRQKIVRITATVLQPCKAILAFEGDIPKIWCHEEKSQEALKKLVDAMTVDKTMFKLDQAEYNALKTQKWETEKAQIEEKNSVLIKIQDCGLIIIGFCKDIESTQAKIRNFLDENAVHMEIVKRKPGEIEYIKKFCSDVKKAGADTTYDEFTITLKGKKHAVQEALTVIQNLNILEDRLVCQYFGIMKYFRAQKGSDLIKQLSKEKKCVIVFHEKQQTLTSQPSTTPKPYSPPKTRNVFSLLKFMDVIAKTTEKKILCQVIEGDITTCRHDAIVNCIGDKFIMEQGGGVCKAIFKKCGSPMQDDLNKQTDPEIRVTSGGKLPAKYAIHTYFTNNIEMMKKRLMKVLATADGLQCKSIAIPAIGTGASGKGPEEIATMMLNVIRNFKSRHLLSIDVVIFDKPILLIFREKFQLAGQQPATTHVYSTTSPRQTTVSMGPLVVTVKRGDITQDKSDMIVNSVGNNFSLSSGNIAQEILKKGGAVIQKELNNAKGGEMRVTNSGNLPCKKIIHVILPDNGDKMKKALKEVLAKCEEECCSTLAFPAIGTGNKNLTSIDIAKNLRQSFLEYVKENSLNHLKEISVVIFEDSKFPDFVQELITSQQGSSTATSSQVSQPWKQITPSERTIGSLKLKVEQGDITEAKTDAIVNSVGSRFRLGDGLVSKAILKKAGDGIQKELEKQSDKEIRLSSGGNLPVKKIIHVNFPEDNGQMGRCLKDILLKCNEAGCQSLALPALGTGTMKLPNEVIAKNMKEAIMEFAQDNTFTKKLKEVTVVIFEKSRLPDFIKQLIKKQDGLSQQIEEKLPFFSSFMRRSFLNPFIYGSYRTASLSTKSFGHVELIVEKGDITDSSTDAIVNSCRDNFDLSAGEISKLIVSKGGDSIQKEVAKSTGDIRCSSGGKLPCKKIFHVTFSNKIDELPGQLHRVFDRMNGEKCSSASIPLIGTGNLSLPTRDVARSMQCAVKHWAANNISSSLTELHVVIYEDAKLQEFLAELKVEQGPKMTQGSGSPLQAPKPQPRVQTGRIEAESTPNHVLQFGKLAVFLQKGDLTVQETDAIVCSSSVNFDMSLGTISKEIKRKGGTKILDELVAAPGNEMRVTSGGDLRCKKIFHVVTTTEPDKVRLCLWRILSCVDNEQCTSVSIPALWTEKLRLPCEKVAHHIIDGIHEASMMGSMQYLQRLYLIISDDSKYTSFHEAISNYKQSEVKMDGSKITFHFYTRHKNALCAAKKKVDEHVESEFDRTSIQVQNIDKLLLWEEEELRKISSTDSLHCYFDRTNGEVKLEGRRQQISEAKTDIKLLDSKVQHVMEDHLLIPYSWRYRNEHGSNWTTFDEWSSKELEKARNFRKGEVCLCIRRKIRFHLNLKDMKITSTDQPVKMSYIIDREVKEDLPGNWEKMPDNENFRLVNLESSSAEYKGIQQKLTATVNDAVVQSVSRVQNKMLYQRYQIEKKRVKKQCPNKEIEMKLFHGTDAGTADKIIKGSGFDRGFAGEANAAYFGKGVYFAKNASYSDQDKYAKPDSDGVRTIFVADVITGEYCIGKPNMRTPERVGSPEPYNSAVDNAKTPSLFVIFKDAGAYPAYIIKYKK